ncbi:MAG: hypothetical protein ABR577_15870 [Pyrinomonadaceae bacterium]
MSMDEEERCDSSDSSESLATDDVPEQTGREVNAHYWDLPPPPPTGKKIHERQYIPPVPAGEEVPDETPSAPVDLE